MPAAPASPSSSPPLTVSWHRHARDLPDSLWQSAMPPPAEGRWWYEALENGRLEDQFDFYYGQIRDQTAAPVGIIPAFAMNVPMDLVAPPEVLKFLRALGPLGRRFLTQRTLFIGNVAGEGGHLGLSALSPTPASFDPIEKALWSLRRKVKAKLIVFKDFDRPANAPLRAFLQSRGYFTVPSYPATTIPVTAASTPQAAQDAYLKFLPQDYRYKLRKKLKASFASVPLSTAFLQRPSAGEMHEIWALFQQTYEHGKTKFENFGPPVFNAFALHPDSHWLTLRRTDSGTMVAFMLLTREPTHWVNRFIGLDYNAPKELFLYYRLFVHAIEFCAGNPRPALLSGQTGYRAKLELGHTLLPLDNFVKHRNPLLHRLYAHIAKSVTWSTLDEELATYLKAHPEDDKSRG